MSVVGGFARLCCAVLVDSTSRESRHDIRRRYVDWVQMASFAYQIILC